MALLDVTSSPAGLRASILPRGQTRLLERTNHYSFGTRIQEFAVPLGVDVSLSHLSRRVIGARVRAAARVRNVSNAARVNCTRCFHASHFSKVFCQRLAMRCEMPLSISLSALALRESVQRWRRCAHRAGPRHHHPGLQVPPRGHRGCGLPGHCWSLCV